MGLLPSVHVYKVIEMLIYAKMNEITKTSSERSEDPPEASTWMQTASLFMHF